MDWLKIAAGIARQHGKGVVVHKCEVKRKALPKCPECSAKLLAERAWCPECGYTVSDFWREHGGG